MALGLISIPYGSIKRKDGSPSVPSLHISIPYGSIKRVSTSNLTVSGTISIPYGSIKRERAYIVASKKPNFNSLWFD